MSVDRHPDWFGVVRMFWNRTTGFLLASREPCLQIRDRELMAVRGRALASRDVADLARWQPPDSWLLAVIVCPGDSIDPIVEWTKRHRADPTRVRFFLHPAASPSVLKSWQAAGYPTDRVDIVADWKELHKLFGLALNDRAYADWKHLAE